MTWRALGAGVALALLMAAAAVAATSAAQPDAGESIYLRGMTGAGVPVEASRSAGTKVKGTNAACVNCHQRSGLGGREGRSAIPPITGRYLYRPRAKEGENRDIPFVEGMRSDREPYNAATLARAVREGIDSEGKALDYLMPRYAISDDDMTALTDYLGRLDRRKVPGVSETALQFATIITPDADPVKRGAMLEVMRQFFVDRNVRQMVPAAAMRSSGRTAYARSMFMVHRNWELHVWELTGPESTWEQQLQKRLAAEPVFAVISGLGGRNWAPVHSFCERAALPCLFPNVEVPVDRQTDFYSLYFTKGVLLEAELLAHALEDASGPKAAKTVVQFYRSGDSGEAGAAALAAAVRPHGVGLKNQAVPASMPPEELARAIRTVPGDAALVLWLRPADLAALGEMPDRWSAVYISGLLGGLEAAPLPASWRARTAMAYPFDLPDRRRVRVDFALGWFRARHIPVVAEQVQADTYLALGLASETLTHMTDAFVPDYLIERVQTNLEHRIVTGYYPRLALATGQRFASKGGYLVKWADAAGRRVVPAGDWTVP